MYFHHLFCVVLHLDCECFGTEHLKHNNYDHHHNRNKNYIYAAVQVHGHIPHASGCKLGS